MNFEKKNKIINDLSYRKHPKEYCKQNRCPYFKC